MSTTTTTTVPDRAPGDTEPGGPPPDVEAFLARFGADQAAGMHLATVILGERLGLFRALRDGGPQTATALAERTGYEPRLVLEWLRVQTVSGYCQHDEASGAFHLTPAQSACLADDDGPTFVAGGLSTVSAVHASIERIAAAFRGERAVPWADHDPGLFVGVARGFRPAYETHLVERWIPALAGIEDRLVTGGRVADLACGFGTSTILLAAGYPATTATGFDQHEVSIGAARRAADEAEVADRVSFEVADAARFGGDGYDLVCIFNALHEMGDPVGVCRRVRERLADGGSLMVVEPVAPDTLAANHNAVGRSFLAASTMVCLPSALSQGGTWHLGAQAPDAEFAAVGRAAGFSRCERVAETPLHRVLELQP
jgi:SAM-dependent methyltransferase